MSRPSPARVAAAEILLAVETRQAWAAELLRARAAGLSAADRGLASELVLGTLRNQGWLDYQLNCYLAQRGWKIDRLDAGLRIALRLGLYQLLWLDRIPIAVVVDQSVNLARALRLASATGLVNAVLRRCARLRIAGLSEELPAPGWENETFLARLSHPRWLLERWRERWGDIAALEIAKFDNTPPALHLAVHPDLVAEQVQSELAVEDVVTERMWLQGALRVRSGDVLATSAFRRRRVWIQSAASQCMAWLLLEGIAAGQRQSNWMADACAAPGGKAALLSSAGQLLALELNFSRASAMRLRFPAREGAGGAQSWPRLHTVQADASLPWPAKAAFDRILLDAPCSGTGTLARTPELRWRLQPGDITRLAELQYRLLANAMHYGADGSRLLYSLCSLEREEGDQVVENALASSRQWRPCPLEEILDCMVRSGRIRQMPDGLRFSGPGMAILPASESGGGFYAALLARSG